MLLITICCLSIFQGINTREVYGATKYVTREKMIEMIVKELGVKINKTSSQPYIEAAKKIGLITEKTFTKYNANASKIDVAILLVRADEYLNGETIPNSLMKEIIEQRISDIGKVKKVLQPYLAKAYALGYIKGNSNGLYSKNRKFNPNNKVTVTYAKQLVSFINDKGKRHEISPDGQLIRITNLPEFAEYYPYILASFPNDYYDWEFAFMRAKVGDKLIYGTDEWVSGYDYAAPVDLYNYRNNDEIWYSYLSRSKISSSDLFSNCDDKWEKNAYDHLSCIFNVDYRTIKDNKEWLEKLVLTDFNGKVAPDAVRKMILDYVNNAIKNKTVIESRMIGVDKSSIFISNGIAYIRAYVSFRLVSSKELDRVMDSPIVFTRDTYPYFIDLKLNEWRDCYINLKVNAMYDNCGIERTIINDYLHDVRVVIGVE